MKVTMINASNQFANISQMQPFPNRRNKKYKTSMNKSNKNGKTTLLKSKNFLNINNEENSYEKILERIMDYNKDNNNMYIKTKKKGSQNLNINDLNMIQPVQKNNNIKLTTKNIIKINPYSNKNRKKKESLTNINKTTKINFDKINIDIDQNNNYNLSEINTNKESLENDKNMDEKNILSIKEKVKIKNQPEMNKGIKNETVNNNIKIISNSNSNNNKEIKEKTNNKILNFENKGEEKGNNNSESNESNKSSIENTNNKNLNQNNDDKDDNLNNNTNNNSKSSKSNNNHNNNNNNSNDNNIKEENKNVYSTPKKNYLNSSHQIEEENENKSSTSKIHFRSLSNTENKNISSVNKENNLNFHQFNFSIYSMKKAKFCCF